VDVGAFEAVALPALQRACALGGVVVIDELGRMELASAAFVTAVRDVLDLDVAVVATVHEADHPVTDALKQRADVARYVVTRESSEALPRLLRARLVPDRLGP
jgi:nucleoside-triphosphatase